MTDKKDMQEDAHRELVSRRDFLKCAGTIVLVMGTGYSALANGESGVPEGTLKNRDRVPPSDGYLLVDIEKCQACVEVCPMEAIRFTKEIPIQEGDKGYKVNLRGAEWAALGYPI